MKTPLSRHSSYSNSGLSSPFRTNQFPQHRGYLISLHRLHTNSKRCSSKLERSRKWLEQKQILLVTKLSATILSVPPISLAKNRHSHPFAVLPCRPFSHTPSCCLPVNRDAHVCLQSLVETEDERSILNMHSTTPSRG